MDKCFSVGVITLYDGAGPTIPEEII